MRHAAQIARLTRGVSTLHSELVSIQHNVRELQKTLERRKQPVRSSIDAARFSDRRGVGQQVRAALPRAQRPTALTFGSFESRTIEGPLG
jgi:hypothetical protein